MHSSQSHTESHAIHTTHKQVSAQLRKLYGTTQIVVSSSGASFTLTELCMCTDFSSFPAAIPMFEGSLVVISGVNYLTDSGALRCQRCNRKRPYRFTSLSTA